MDKKKSTETILEYGTGIVYQSDLNEKIKTGEIDDVIMFSETLQSVRMSRLADLIVDERARVVLVAGPSASGKTTFTKRLCMHLWINGKKPIYLGTDDYYLARELIQFEKDGTRNFDKITALDLDLFNHQLKQLMDGEEVDIPRFNFLTGEPEFGTQKTVAYPEQIIVVEGIFGLNPMLTSEIDDALKFRIYIEPSTEPRIDDARKIQTSDIRKLRRMVRDNSHRGWDCEHTLDAWEKVRLGEYENIIPYKDTVNAYFDSSFVYDLSALKPHVAPLLKEIKQDNKYYKEAQRLLEILSHSDPLPSERCIPSNSIMREFIGGSAVVD